MANVKSGGFVRDSNSGALIVSGQSLTPSGIFIPGDGCLLNFRKAAVRARHGGRAVRVNCKGDSTTLGTLSGTNPNTLLRKDYVWFSRARQGLQINGGLGAIGQVEESIMQMNTADDARFTYAGGATGPTLAATQTMTFADAAGHDAYDLCILRSGGAASVSVSVDAGGAQVLDLTTVVNNQAGTFRVTGVGTGAHSVVITGPAAGTAQFTNVEPITLATPPIIKLGGVGASGQTLAALNPSATGSGSQMAPILRPLPDLMFLLMGVNDMRGSADLVAGAATFKANVTAFVTAFQAQGTDVVLMTAPSYFSNQSGVPSQDESVLFHQAIYDVARATNCAVLDVQRRWGYGVASTTGASSTPVTNSAMYDGTHPTLYGYWDIGRMVAYFLASIV